MSDERTGLLMTLLARPENVAVIRHAIAGLAEELGMEEPGLSDLKTVVTEACMNVVVHAYDDGLGPIHLEVTQEDDGLTICVRDFGEGIRPRPDFDRPSLRLGLTLIAALATRFEISGGLHSGTEVKMHLPLRSPGNNGAGRERQPREEAQPGIDLTVDDPRMVAPVLSRVVGALAARGPIAVDRVSDAMLFTDGISEQAPRAFADGHLCFAVAENAEGIELRVGPVPSGNGELLRRSLGLPEVGGSLESLPDELRVEEDETGEYLIVRFAGLTT